MLYGRSCTRRSRTHDAPSTLLGVTVLGYTNQLVEIEAVALAGQQDPAARESALET